MAIDYSSIGSDGVIPEATCKTCGADISANSHTNKWEHMVIRGDEVNGSKNVGDILQRVKGVTDFNSVLDNDHEPVPHDGRSIQQDNAMQELQEYDVIKNMKGVSVTPRAVSPELFSPTGKLGRQFTRYVSPPPNKWGSVGPGRFS